MFSSSSGLLGPPNFFYKGIKKVTDRLVSEEKEISIAFCAGCQKLQIICFFQCVMTKFIGACFKETLGCVKKTLKFG